MVHTHSRLCPDLVYRFLQLFALFLTISAFLIDSISEIWQGLEAIIVSPSNLTTDYIELGGLGATLLNSGILTFLSLFMLRRHEHYFSPNTVLTVMLLAGYSFWGKNLFNAAPIFIGLSVYLKQKGDDSQTDIAAGMLGTALAPAVSLVFFYSDDWQMKGIALLLGFLIGYTIVPVFKKVQNFTRGLNLYNMGFAAGVLSIAVNIVVTKLLGVPVPWVRSEVQHDKEIFYLLLALFAAAGLYGIYIFFKYHFVSVQRHKLVVTCIHQRFALRDTSRIFKFSIYGFIGLGIVELFHGQLNGPVAGTILIFTGFSMYYYHFGQYLAPALGVMLSYVLFFPDAGVSERLIAVLFVSTMAPFTKKYGILLGFLSGMLFPAVSRQLNILHDGINLYNSGFAGGVTAILMYGVRREVKRIPFLRKIFFGLLPYTYQKQQRRLKQWFRRKFLKNSIEIIVIRSKK
ncbi:DUF1576 domain-containing protein [Enterococcus olivae]